MNILCIGDVTNSIGIDFLLKKLPELKRAKKIDVVIANGENSAGGIGITAASAKMIFDSGVDVITTGNHAFAKRDSYDFYETCREVIRPANYPEGTTPGRGYTVVDMLKWRVCVINLMGALYLNSPECPFKTADRILKETADCQIKIVDFHAEATAEKRALGYYLDGRVSALFGTHTHVQTADECILPHGTGYITDVGMTGPIDSVLGMRTELSIKQFTTKMPVRMETAEGACRMDCVLFNIDEKTGKTVSLERMSVR